jgi:hypothetical protein
MGANDRYGDRMLKSHTQAKSVLVNLAALFPPLQNGEHVDGLKLTGWAPGALSDILVRCPHGWHSLGKSVMQRRWYAAQATVEAGESWETIGNAMGLSGHNAKLWFQSTAAEL